MIILFIAIVLEGYAKAYTQSFRRRSRHQFKPTGKTVYTKRRSLRIEIRVLGEAWSMIPQVLTTYGQRSGTKRSLIQQRSRNRIRE
jgi:hypothetical protein